MYKLESKCLLRSETSGKLGFFCPGCKMLHLVNVDQEVTPGNPKWDWNADYINFTFRPSVLVTMGRNPDRICHSWVTDGYINFLGDSTHELAGQVVKLPPIPADEID